MYANIPEDEAQRLAALARYELLHPPPDNPPESACEGVVRLVTQLLDVPMAAVTVIGSTTVWLKAQIGFSVREVDRDVTFCTHTVYSPDSLIVEDATCDARFRGIPLVCGEAQVRFYVGVPLRTPEGQTIAVLCALDRRSRRLGSEQLDVLHLLADQVMHVLNQRRQAIELRESRARLDQVSRLQRAIVGAQHALLSGQELSASYGAILSQVLQLTESAFGFIGEVMYREGRPALRSYALSDLSWDEETRRLYEAGLETGLVFERLDTLYGHVLRTGEPLISNDPDGDPRRGGTPTGHPHLSAFLGLPIRHCESLVGMIGVANRPGGYDAPVVESLEPFLNMCAGLIVAQRSEAQRREAERQLSEAHRALRRSHDELSTILDQLAVGTLVLEPDGAISYVSSALAELPVRWAAPLATGTRWDQALPLSEPDRDALAEQIRRPTQHRLRVRLRGTARTLDLDVDVREDPRSSARRVLFFYDMTTVLALQRELSRRASGEMIGESPKMHALYELIAQVASGSWTVLIEGETGVGKELVARAIHARSPRREGPFVAVNCAGLSEALLSSQLFGHARGAFTGAVADRVGLFEAANHGTLFLDEIGDISPAVQVALLRALEQREVMRVGEVRTRPVDVRVIVATNRDLSAEVSAGRFRKDLYYRVRVGRVSVPPLRERAEDIPLLVSYFLAQARLSSARAATEVQPEALARLCAYTWPGNVRELKNAIEHAVIRCRGGQVTLGDLPPEILDHDVPAGRPRDERADILDALSAEGGNRIAAAKRLGISRATLYRRLERLGILD